MLEFSRAAEADLLEIFLYTIEEHGLAQAARYKSRLERGFRIIADNPKIARLRREITPPVRVYPVQRHVIVYTLAEDGETALVLRVRHHRENWTDHPME